MIGNALYTVRSLFFVSKNIKSKSLSLQFILQTSRFGINGVMGGKSSSMNEIS